MKHADSLKQGWLQLSQQARYLPDFTLLLHVDSKISL